MYTRLITPNRNLVLALRILLEGAQVKMPPETGTFIAAQKVKKIEGKQAKFDIG